MHPLSRSRATTICAALALAAGLGATALLPAPAGAAQPAVSAQAASAPSAPRQVTAVLTAPGEVTVTWEAPSSAGSSAVTGYTVVFSTGQSGGGQPAAASDRSAVFTGLSKATYTFSVYATNAVGDGPRASTTLAVPAANAPTIDVSTATIVSGDGLTVSGTGATNSRAAAAGLPRPQLGHARHPRDRRHGCVHGHADRALHGAVPGARRDRCRQRDPDRGGEEPDDDRRGPQRDADLHALGVRLPGPPGPAGEHREPPRRRDVRRAGHRHDELDGPLDLQAHLRLGAHLLAAGPLRRDLAQRVAERPARRPGELVSARPSGCSPRG